MSYSTEVVKQNVERDMLVLMRPRRRVTSWTLHSGSVYYNDFSFGYVTGVKVDGAALTAGSSASLSAGQYYYDFDAARLYIRKSSGTPSGTDWIISTFELYVATKEFNWHRNPLDDTTPQVLWRGLISDSPEISRSADELVLGFLPIASTSVKLSNEAEYLQEMIDESSFNLAECVVYRMAGDELDVDNFDKLFTGVCDEPEFDDKSVSINILDKSYNLDAPIDNGSSDTLLPDTAGTDGSGVDQAYAGAAIRQLYGRWQGVRFICVDAEIDAPTTSHNRDWMAMTQEHGASHFDATITSVVSNFVKQVSTNDAQLIAEMWAMGFSFCALGSSIRQITGVNVSTGNITIDASFVGGATLTILPFNCDAFTRGIYLIRDSITFYKLAFGTQWSIAGVGGYGGYGVILNSGIEADFGLASNLNPQTDTVVADAAGALILPTINGSVVRSPYNPVVILYWILTEVLGLSSDEIDEATFASLAATSRCRAGLSLPDDVNGEFPTHKDVIQRLLVSDFLQAFFDQDGKFTIRRIEPMGAADLSVTDVEINDVKFDYSYKDLGSVKCQNGPRELYVIRSKADIVAASSSGPCTLNTNTLQFDQSSEYDANTYLHQNDRVRTIPTAFVEAPLGFAAAITWTGKPDLLTAAEYAERMAQVLGERQLRASCFIKVGAESLDVGSVINITRTRMPGFAFDGTTEHSKDFRVIEIKKSRSGVRVVLSDQKGIEDNTGDWT